MSAASVPAVTPEERKAVLDSIGRVDGHLPARHKDGFDCPRCGRWAHQVWSEIEINEVAQVVVPGSDLMPGVAPQTGYALAWLYATCQRCRQPSVWHGDDMVYPRRRLGHPAHQDMPPEVSELYEEAAQVATVSRRAGAALARATVERLIKLLDQEAPKKATLDQRIERLRPRVSSSLGEMLEVVKYLGNKMLHAEDPDKLGELVVVALDDTEGPQLVEMLLETINDLVDELITKPKTVAGVRDRLPEALRKKLAGSLDTGHTTDQ